MKRKSRPTTSCRACETSNGEDDAKGVVNGKVSKVSEVGKVNGDVRKVGEVSEVGQAGQVGQGKAHQGGEVI
jgi:hypothetical protein